MEFVEPEDEPGLFRNPLPPDDRLWRHPSELGANLPANVYGGLSGSPTGSPTGDPSAGAATGSSSPAGDPPGADESRPSLWLVAAVSAVSAGLLATGLAMLAVGLLGTNDPLRPVVERQMEPRPIDAETPGGIVDVADRAREAVVQLRVDGASAVVGSGVLFRSDGYMLTAASVVGKATSVRVTLDSGRELTGRVVGTDPDGDTAVIKIDGEGPFPTAVMGTAADLRVGQQAIAIGFPTTAVGGELAGGPSLTVGVISALHRSVRRESDGGVLLDMVQTDARVPTGWPGGALLDSSGSVIGITTALGTGINGNGAGGFGFAVPIDRARWVAEQLITTGRVREVWLGVQGSDLDWGAAAGLDVTGGALVGGVMGDSPAARAGLADDDVIVGIDGVAVTSMGQLVVALRAHVPGDVVTLDVMRDHRRMPMVVVLTERPTRA